MNLLEHFFIMNNSPIPVCHTSTILRKEDGSFLFSWFGGSYEGNPDVGMFLCRRDLRGNFSAPERMASSKEAHWNPVLFSPEKNRVCLFYKVGDEIAKWRTYMRISKDGGKSFGEERELVPGDMGGRGPVRNKPVRLENGRILCPASQEKEIWTGFVDISDDGCKTFHKSNPIRIPGLEPGKRKTERDEIPVSPQSYKGRGVIQPALWEEGNGKVHMLLRSSEGFLYRSDSFDWGETWGEAYPTMIPNNNSGIDIGQLSDGRLILVYNPVAENWGKRSPLSLSLSLDGGEHFERVMDLESGEGEFSYPAVITYDREAWITYTYQRKNIACCHMTLD